MAYVVAGIILFVGFPVAAITATSGFYGSIPLKISVGATVAAGLIALTHHRIPNW